MVRTIVFDLGGVLFTEGKSIAAINLARQYDYDRELVMRILTSPQSVALRKGLSTDEDFWGWAQKQLPQGYDAQIIRGAWYDGYLLDSEIFALIERLSHRYRTVAYSGNIKSRIEYLDQKYDFQRLFDEKIYSFDVHLDKPQKAFVQCLLDRLDQHPEEIVYIDDEASATVPAIELGIKALLYTSGAIRELRAHLSQAGVEV